MDKQLKIKSKGELDIIGIEILMLQHQQVECPVIHRFGPNLYIREVRIPANTLAMGHYQKCEHMNLFLQGKLTIFNDDGSTAELAAPMIFTAPAGRKMGYVHEDVVWLNIYSTEETDVETLEMMYLDKSDAWKADKKVKTLMAKGKREIDVEDYKQVLSEFGFTEKQVRQQTENEEDQLSTMPIGDYKILISDSNIEGKGLFASAKINYGELIGPARVDGKRTPIGRYVNHSILPNAIMVNASDDIYLFASEEIEGCYGGQTGEEITTDYRTNLKLIGRKSCQV